MYPRPAGGRAAFNIRFCNGFRTMVTLPLYVFSVLARSGIRQNFGRFGKYPTIVLPRLFCPPKVLATSATTRRHVCPCKHAKHVPSREGEVFRKPHDLRVGEGEGLGRAAVVSWAILRHSTQRLGRIPCPSHHQPPITGRPTPGAPLFCERIV